MHLIAFSLIFDICSFQLSFDWRAMPRFTAVFVPRIKCPLSFTPAVYSTFCFLLVWISWYLGRLNSDLSSPRRLSCAPSAIHHELKKKKSFLVFLEKMWYNHFSSFPFAYICVIPLTTPISSPSWCLYHYWIYQKKRPSLLLSTRPLLVVPGPAVRFPFVYQCRSR